MSHRSFTANVLFTRSVNSHNEPTDHWDSGSSPAVRKFIADHTEFIRVGVSLLSIPERQGFTTEAVRTNFDRCNYSEVPAK